ncbi:hypothetical protein ALISP_1886 [Alicycliphilus sp. B1]|nr:hypothetical protein ALISP_1886 [Alicycliphilus sp. B1]
MTEMLNAKRVFHENIRQANELGGLYDHLTATVAIQDQFNDLLRSQIVYAVSAFDKLMHDLIRIGMVEIFLGNRATTPKYQNEAVPIQYLSQLLPGSAPPPEVRFTEIIRERHSALSFQDPSKIADGLALIWEHNQKWQQIAQGLGVNDSAAKVKLKLIITRRNAIVHEADLNPVTNTKQTITRAEAMDSSDFLLALGNRICELVI